MRPEASPIANNVSPGTSTVTPVTQNHQDHVLEYMPLASAPRTHIAFLDGIRGLSALYVVLYHCVIRGELGVIGHRLTGWMEYGRFAVDVFIVLSGYCLMLPVARSTDRQLRGGIRQYIKRRARRILPPYYGSMIVAIVFVSAGRYMKHGQASVGMADPTALSPGNLLTHILLMHNLFRAYVTSLNPVLWTVALEWQLYFVFPILLLPLWRRTGFVSTVFLACLLGISPLVLAPNYNLGWTCPWFVGLFAMGMAAAVVTESRKERFQSIVLRIPWGWLSLLCVAVPLVFRLPDSITWWLNDLIVGGAAAMLILHCVRCLRGPSSRPADLLVRLFQSRPAVGLGMFSYSLYLIHDPFNWILRSFLRSLHLSHRGQFFFSLFIDVPLVIALSYGFYLLCERPFVASKSASVQNGM